MKLFAHQQKLLNDAPDRHLLAWGCGTGKTLASLALAESKTKSILIICPKSLKEQWREQCNYDVMSKEEFKKHANKIIKYECLIVDEAHFFGGMQGFRKKSGLLKALMHYIGKYSPPYRYLLTATPYMSSPWNIYALAEILGRKWDYMQYKNMFFTEVNMGKRWPIPVVRKGIEPKIAELVNKLGSTVKMEDCFDVPDQIFQTEYFELTKEQKQAIEEIEDTNHLVRWTKQHCIENGILNSDGYSEDKYYKSEKTERIIELCEEHKKIAIVARYNLQLKLYKELLEKKYKVFLINGQTKNKNEIVNTINNLDECVVLIQAAMSEGYNLWSVPIMIFASMDFSLKNFVQIKGRLLRANHLKKNIYKFLLLNKKSVDYGVYKNVVINKMDFQTSIFKI